MDKLYLMLKLAKVKSGKPDYSQWILNKKHKIKYTHELNYKRDKYGLKVAFLRTTARKPLYLFQISTLISLVFAKLKVYSLLYSKKHFYLAHSCMQKKVIT